MPGWCGLRSVAFDISNFRVMTTMSAPVADTTAQCTGGFPAVLNPSNQNRSRGHDTNRQSLPFSRSQVCTRRECSTKVAGVRSIFLTTRNSTSIYATGHNSFAFFLNHKHNTVQGKQTCAVSSRCWEPSSAQSIPSGYPPRPTPILTALVGAGVLRGQRSPATQVHKARSQGCVAVRDRCSLLGSEFKKTALATIIGFAIMGFIGFFVKLVFIPINVILVRAE